MRALNVFLWGLVYSVFGLAITFIVVLALGVREQRAVWDPCVVNENVSDAELWHVYPECVVIEKYSNVSLNVSVAIV